MKECHIQGCRIMGGWICANTSIGTRQYTLRALTYTRIFDPETQLLGHFVRKEWDTTDEVVNGIVEDLKTWKHKDPITGLIIIKVQT